MCGLAGFSGIKSAHQRLMLVIGLGIGIDMRGGDAAGYVSISADSFRYNKKRGLWTDSRLRFMKGAASGDLCLMHSRFATCGMKTIEEAHPFAVKRDGKVVLWGAHNGVIPDAWECAWAHNRDIDVDSQEVFELIADKELETLQSLNGYGVVTWVESETPDHIKLAKLSDSGEIFLVSLESGGYAWASTWKILAPALKDAGLKAKHHIETNEVGRVYEIHKDKIVTSDMTGVMVGSYMKKYMPLFGMSNLSSNAGMSRYELEIDALNDRWSDHMTDEGYGRYSRE